MYPQKSPPKVCLLCLQSGQGQLRDAVLHQYTRLQQDLAASDVLELPAGVPYLLRSSAVLLKGTLKVSGRHYSEGRKGGIPFRSVPCIHLSHWLTALHSAYA